MSNKPLKIHLFCCSSSFDPGELTRGSEQSDEIRVIPLPCSGKIDILYLTKAFESGADGVAIVMCKRGECRYLKGNLHAQKRAEAVDALLEEVGLGRGRMTVIQMDDGGMEQVIREVDEFRVRIRDLPVSVPVRS